MGTSGRSGARAPSSYSITRRTGRSASSCGRPRTLKICANHLVISTMKMQEHAGSNKSCVWHVADFADGELKEEMFAIRFGSVESELSAPFIHLVPDLFLLQLYVAWLSWLGIMLDYTVYSTLKFIVV